MTASAISVPTITIGADPELFVRNKTTGKIVSAHDLIPGTKEKPWLVPGGAVQVDGVAAEFNIDPTTSAEGFCERIQYVMGHLQGMMPGYELVTQPCVVFDKDYFYSLPEKTRELGCNPDWNAWTERTNPAPDAGGTMRTASGHIHIGWAQGQNINDPFWMEDCFAVVKQLDYYIGAVSHLWDNDGRRRELYGRAGACRVKPYGVEYRVPSNRWLISPKLMKFIWYASYYAVKGLIDGSRPRMEEKYGDLVRSLIDTGTTDDLTNGKFMSMYEETGLDWPKW